MQSVAGTLRTLTAAAAGFLVWWRDELAGLAPERLRGLMSADSTRIVIAQTETHAEAGFRVFEEGGSDRSGRGAAVAEPLSLQDAVLAAAELAAGRPDVPIGVRLPLAGCFVRTVELPAAARTDAARILELDLERSTPFKLKDIYTAVRIDETSPPAAGKLKARQLIIKRERIDPILQAVRAAGLPVAFADCWDETGNAPLPVDFLAAGSTDAKGPGRLLTLPVVLAGLAALLAVTGVYLAIARYESALESLQARVAQTRTQAATVRRAFDSSDAALAELNRLQEAKLAQIPVVEVLDELAKLLPDTVWVSDLRLEGETLDISGLAGSGSKLLPLFERSKLFAEASLTAPLTFDQQEDKERFSLRVRIRQPAAASRITGEEKQ